MNPIIFSWCKEYNDPRSGSMYQFNDQQSNIINAKWHWSMSSPLRFILKFPCHICHFSKYNFFLHIQTADACTAQYTNVCRLLCPFKLFYEDIRLFNWAEYLYENNFVAARSLFRLFSAAFLTWELFLIFLWFWNRLLNSGIDIYEIDSDWDFAYINQ